MVELRSELYSFQCSMTFAGCPVGNMWIIFLKGEGTYKNVEYQLSFSNKQGRSKVKAQADVEAGLPDSELEKRSKV